MSRGTFADSAGPLGSHGWSGVNLPSTIGEFAVPPGSRNVICFCTAVFASRNRDLLMPRLFYIDKPCQRPPPKLPRLSRLHFFFNEPATSVIYTVSLRGETLL